ncbi:MAG: hypothetical protein J1E39_08085 [Eubacterium sp.]|nr:hypothetical protein [Eubacterium sp.]
MKKSYTIPAIIGALMLMVASAAYIVMKIAQQEQMYRDKWKDYDDCGI